MRTPSGMKSHGKSLAWDRVNDEAQKLTNFVQSTPDEYCPLSPASSDHSVYQPPALTNQSYSEDSKTNLGKVVSYFWCEIKNFFLWEFFSNIRWLVILPKSVRLFHAVMNNKKYEKIIASHVSYFFYHFCIVLLFKIFSLFFMPHPSAWTIYFLTRTKNFVPS